MSKGAGHRRRIAEECIADCAPQGHLSLNARELTLAASKHSQLPTLGVGVEGNWNGRIHGRDSPYRARSAAH
jgi:hypothetical protein